MQGTPSAVITGAARAAGDDHVHRRGGHPKRTSFVLDDTAINVS